MGSSRIRATFVRAVKRRFFLLFLNQYVALRLQLADGRHFIGKALLQKCPGGVVQIELCAVFFAKTLFVLCLKESAVDGFVGMVLPDIMDLLVQFFDAVIGFAQRGTGRRQFMIGCLEGSLQFLAAVVAVLLNKAERFRGFTQIAERYLSRIGGALLGFQIALQIRAFSRLHADC